MEGVPFFIFIFLILKSFRSAARLPKSPDTIPQHCDLFTEKRNEKRQCAQQWLQVLQGILESSFQARFAILSTTVRVWRIRSGGSTSGTELRCVHVVPVQQGIGIAMLTTFQNVVQTLYCTEMPLKWPFQCAQLCIFIGWFLKFKIKIKKNCHWPQGTGSSAFRVRNECSVSGTGTSLNQTVFSQSCAV